MLPARPHPDVEPAAAARPRVRRIRAVAARHPLWLEWLTRLGYAARGAVYLVVGATGLLLALGLAERARGSPAVMRLIVGLPMGRVLLAALTVGLVGYSLLSLVAAVRAPEGRAGPLGVLARVSDALAGMAYAGLSALAVRLLADPSADTGAAGERWAAHAFALPGGRALLLLAGVACVAAGFYLAFKAAALPVATHLERRRTPRAAVRVVTALARAGTAARAVLFVVCGALVVHGAWTGEPGGVGGIGNALDAIADAPAGPAIVGLIAGGCVAYGLYQLAKARWRRVTLG